jgi:hypothetical protein
MADLPDLYFRSRETGATVFRLETDARNNRLELVPIAVANTRNGQIRPQGGRSLTEAEEAAIRNWMSAREAELAARRVDDIRRAIDHLNLVAAWAHQGASDAELDAFTDPLLLAMHDLRGVLVRRKADRLTARSQGATDEEED